MSQNPPTATPLTILDIALDTAYFNVSAVLAAGSCGLTVSPRFTNFSTHCCHPLWKGYNLLAPAIGELLAWDDHHRKSGTAGV